MAEEPYAPEVRATLWNALKPHWKLKEVRFKTQDEVDLNGWYIPPQKGKPTVLMALGKSSSVVDAIPSMAMFQPKGYGVLAFDYRTYGHSKTDKPLSEEGFCEDLRSASRFLEKDLETPISQQILVGSSLGCIMATHLAAKQSEHPHQPQYKALVLGGALSSVADLIDGMQLPFGVLTGQKKTLVRFLEAHYDIKSHLPKVRSPILFIHGARDNIAPVSMAQTNYQAAKSGHTSRTEQLIYPEAEHYGVLYYDPSQTLNRLQGLLAS